MIWRKKWQKYLKRRLLVDGLTRSRMKNPCGVMCLVEEIGDRYRKWCMYIWMVNGRWLKEVGGGGDGGVVVVGPGFRT